MKSKEAGQIKIDFIDRQGNVIREIMNEYKAVGNYTQNVEFGQLKGMIFYYRIVDANGVVNSKKFMVAQE